MDLGSIANAASGGILGLVGAGVGAVDRHLRARAEAKRRELDRRHELKLLELQSKLKVEETEAELEAERQRGSLAGLQAGLEADAAEFSSDALPRWVRSARALWKPVLTVVLLLVTYMLWRDLVRLAGEGEGVMASLMTPEQAAETAMYIVRSAAFTASTAAMWWFADRALKPRWNRRRQ